MSGGAQSADVTHLSAETVGVWRASQAEAAEAVRQRAAQQRQYARVMDTLPARFRSRGMIQVDAEGQLSQAFSCGCGKPASLGSNSPGRIEGDIPVWALPSYPPDEQAKELARRVERSRALSSTPNRDRLRR